MMSNKDKFPHYHKYVGHLEFIDTYRVCELYGVSGPIENAVKKLLCSGARGAKDQEQDLREAITSISRKLEMLYEDSAYDANNKPA
jgi:hypothetical protein